MCISDIEGKYKASGRAKSGDMTGSEVLQLQFDRLLQEFKNTLGKLKVGRLAWRPAARMNDIGSLLWHSARAWDGYLFYLDGGEELFVSQEWAKRFEMRRKPKDSWVEVFTEDQVAFVRARPKLFVEYLDAIHQRTRNVLRAATPERLSELVQIPWWPDQRPKAFVLAHVIRHSYEHLGEAQYVQGLMKAKPGKPRAKSKNSKKNKRKN